MVEAKKHADRLFLFYIFLLLVFGLIALMSASAPSGYEKFGDTYFFVKRQILFGILPGIVAFFVVARINYLYFKKLSWPIYILTVVMLGLVLVPSIGLIINGSKSWLNIFGYTFQPSELAKLGLIIILAKLLSETKRNLSDWQSGLLPVLFFVLPPLVLILLQPDLGTLSILVVIILVMLYLAEVPKKYLGVMGLIGLVVMGGMIMAAPYRLQRLTTFLHPELDPQGQGYHINQAFLAIGSGGVWGLGLGHSRQKFQYLPEVSADSIFAVIAEETGLVFSVALLALILLIGWRGLKIAKQAPDEFGMLFTAGVVVWFVWQSFLNIGAMVGILPLTGVPLPFVSHGGSAMFVALIAVGMVASVSKSN